MNIEENLNDLRTGFAADLLSGYEQRKGYLEKLYNCIKKYEEDIFQALYIDLKKSKEEALLTEVGFVKQELRLTIKKLKSWMSPKRVGTNFINLPGKSRIYSEPLGVVLIISPWNYPFNLLFTPLIGAIAAGNTVVLKPSEFAAATADIMEKIVREAFPKNIVYCAKGEGSVVIPKLMENFRFDHIFYTGSTSVGKKIYEAAAKNLSPVTLELGGKSPCVVEADANIDVAAKRIVFSKFSNAGQTCVAPDYVVVHESKYDALCAALKKYIFEFYTNPENAGYDLGKIINQEQFNRLKNYLKEGEVLDGGKIDDETLQISPTLLGNVDLNDKVMQEEIFGPILPILKFTDRTKAINLISENANPLAFYIFSSTEETAKEWLKAIPSGGACVNNAIVHLANDRLPFGGRGNSGMGSYHGKKSFDTFSHQKSVLFSSTWFDPKMKYPPYKGKINLLKKIMG